MKIVKFCTEVWTLKTKSLYSSYPINVTKQMKNFLVVFFRKFDKKSQLVGVTIREVGTVIFKFVEDHKN